MDEITKGWIDDKAKQFPNHSIQFSHQFLDGTDRHECGFIPNDWNGKTIYFERVK